MNGEDRIVGSAMRRPWLVANLFAFTIGCAAAGGALRFQEQPSAQALVIVRAVVGRCRGADVASIARVASATPSIGPARAHRRRWMRRGSPM
jgi:hypothetical protein